MVSFENGSVSNLEAALPSHRELTLLRIERAFAVGFTLDRGYSSGRAGENVRDRIIHHFVNTNDEFLPTDTYRLVLTKPATVDEAEHHDVARLELSVPMDEMPQGADTPPDSIRNAFVAVEYTDEVGHPEHYLLTSAGSFRYTEASQLAKRVEEDSTVWFVHPSRLDHDVVAQPGPDLELNWLDGLMQIIETYDVRTLPSKSNAA